MADGTYLPNSTQIYCWDGSAFITNTLISGAWSPNGNITLNPGEGAWLYNPTSSTFVVTFVGTIQEGLNTNSLSYGLNFISSPIPQAGGLTNNLSYIPTHGDVVYQWDATNQTYIESQYIDPLGTPLHWSPSAPVMGVGQGFYLYPGSNAESWVTAFWLDY